MAFSGDSSLAIFRACSLPDEVFAMLD